MIRRRMTPRRLHDAFGTAIALRLMELFGGRRIPRPPSRAEKQRKLRDNQIRTDKDAGITYRELAERYDLSLRRVIEICSRSSR